MRSSAFGGELIELTNGSIFLKQDLLEIFVRILFLHGALFCHALYTLYSSLILRIQPLIIMLIVFFIHEFLMHSFVDECHYHHHCRHCWGWVKILIID